MARQINQAGLDLIRVFEGLRLEAYLDPVGIWTIGYGHTEGVRQGMRVTAGEAEELLLQDLAGYEAGVEALLKVPVNDNEFSALVSFAYNAGLGALKNSTALKRLNAGDRLGAAAALEWWNKARIGGKLTELRGLTRRRAAERALFLTPHEIPGPSPVLEENSRVPPLSREARGCRARLNHWFSGRH